MATLPVPGPTDVLGALHQAVDDIGRALEGLEDWGPAHTKPGQYRSDLVADQAALDVLLPAGMGVFSEESGGHHLDRPLIVVVDPVDGSTNASKGLPWWATSLCALDADGPLAAVVANQATGQRFEAVRGGGARVDGRPIQPTACDRLDRAIVGLNGFPGRWLGWSQYRCLGAAALDLCAVACGQLDAFIDCAPTSLATWDYLGGVLICWEAGAVVEEPFGRELVVDGPARRTVVAASTRPLADSVADARRSLGGPPE